MSLLEYLQTYKALPEPCYCGERKGHVGWLVCALDPEKATGRRLGTDDDTAQDR